MKMSAMPYSKPKFRLSKRIKEKIKRLRFIELVKKDKLVRKFCK